MYGSHISGLSFLVGPFRCISTTNAEGGTARYKRAVGVGPGAIKLLFRDYGKVVFDLQKSSGLGQPPSSSIPSLSTGHRIAHASGGTPRNQRHATGRSVAFAPGPRMLVFDFAMDGRYLKLSAHVAW
eukprot:1603594-Rhodomonas_salina.1